MSYNSKRTGQEVENLLDKIDDKVDKVEGKQLSTEDFTTALKNKLNSLNNYDDTEINDAINALREDFDTLVSGDTTTAIKTFNEVIAFLDGIQDTQDLSGIIASIEQQIAGKMDKVTLATVATSGSYNDLADKPTIPDVSNKQDKLVSGTNIKTINGENILGDGDLKIDIDTSEIEAKLEVMQKTIGTHNKEVRFFGIEPVTVKVGDVEHYCEANQVSTVFVGDEDFEIIPTSNRSIQSLLGYPIPLKWFDWLEGVEVFDGIVFDMNELDTYKHWIQYYQGDYHVQKAQYANCVFWSDKPYTHSPFEERTNYTIYYSSQLPLCYSRIPANTYKPFYFAYGVNSDPNWRNPDYVSSYSNVSGATQTFSYYGATAIGIFDMGVDIITLPKDCRGLMYHAPAITHAGVFDAAKTTNFGAKKGSWQEAFGDCISLTSLYIRNLKTSINISWSPINNESLEFIIQNAANTSKITISVSPYTWYRLTDEIKAAATAKNITLALITTNYTDDSRWVTKQNSISDLETIREGAALGATALQSIPDEYITVTELDGKVDKIEGKGLSTEDFTTILKQKLEGLSNYDDTAISQAVDKLRTDLDALVSGDTTTAIKTFNEVIAFLDGIQDTQDLSGIIASIEQQIAGKMDKVTLAAVATSGSYNDLADKPTIPSDDSVVHKAGAETISGAKTFNSGVNFVGSGDSNAVTLSTNTRINVNGTNKTVLGFGSGTFYINHGDYNLLLRGKGTRPTYNSADVAMLSDVNSKQDKLVSGSSIKTINGNSLLGSGDITISGGITAENDPIFLASPAATITEEKIAEWEGKMDKVTLATVATSGSYNDLSNKPTIPDVSNKQDKLVSGTNIKTINGTSLLGSGDIVISGGEGGGYDDTEIKSQINELEATIGDINTILESIIGNSIITFTIGDTEYQAEQGMTWGTWVNSKYNHTGEYIANTYTNTIIKMTVDNTTMVTHENGTHVQIDEIILKTSYLLRMEGSGGQ